MSAYQHAARLNNQAVASLFSDNYQISIDLLGKSVIAMKQELSKPETNKTELESSSCSNIATLELPMLKRQRNFFIFNQAFQISEDDEDDCVCRDTLVNTAAVLFNLALAHHRYFLNNDRSDDQEKRKKYLSTAEKLYSTTMKLLNKRSCQHSCMGLIIKLASISNLSSIRSDHSCEVASEALQTISFFMSTVGAISDSENTNLFEETKFQALLMNVLLLRVPKAAAAA